MANMVSMPIFWLTNPPSRPPKKRATPKLVRLRIVCAEEDNSGATMEPRYSDGKNSKQASTVTAGICAAMSIPALFIRAARKKPSQRRPVTT